MGSVKLSVGSCSHAPRNNSSAALDSAMSLSALSSIAGFCTVRSHHGETLTMAPGVASPFAISRSGSSTARAPPMECPTLPIAAAAQAAFTDLDLLLASFDTGHDDHDTARGALVDFYLSAEHRDQPGTGCPTVGFAGDMAREPAAAEVRETYASGVEAFAAWLSAGADDGLAMVATLVGAILLARATVGTDLSEKILESTHQALTAPGS